MATKAEDPISRDLLVEVLRYGAKMGFLRDLRYGPLYVLWLTDGRAAWAPTVAGLLDERRKLEEQGP